MVSPLTLYGGKDMKIKCWWIFGHNWKPWNDVVWGKEKKQITHNVLGYTVIYQTRECKDCKMTQMRSSEVV